MIMKTGLTVDEGLEIILAHCKNVSLEEVTIEDACDRILAKDICSPENIPPFPRSPLDGYTFRHEDTLSADEEHPVRLKIIEEIPAGKAPEKRIEKGQCAHIMTGGPIPDGADAVEKFELVKLAGDEIELNRAYSPMKNVVPMGEEIRIGDLVMEKGSKISPAYQGILAGLGFSKLPVYRKPAVTLISTGSELVSVDSVLTPGKIRNSSIYTLKGFLETEEVEVRLAPIVSDSIEEIEHAIRLAIQESDLVITTGGVSVGDYDLLMKTMEKMKAEILFWKLDMKPGMAFLASCLEGKMVLSLSGNPSAAVSSLLMLGIPFVRKLSGRTDYHLRKTKMYLRWASGKKNRMKRYIPGRIEYEDGKAYLTAYSHQSNGILHPLHGCEGLAYIPNDKEKVSEDELVDVFLL